MVHDTDEREENKHKIDINTRKKPPQNAWKYKICKHRRKIEIHIKYNHKYAKEKYVLGKRKKKKQRNMFQTNVRLK